MGPYLECPKAKIYKYREQYLDKKDEKDNMKIGGRILEKDSVIRMEEELLDGNWKADRKLPKKTLFSEDHEYKLGDTPLSKNLYQRVLRKRNNVRGGLHFLSYVIKSTLSMGLYVDSKKRSMEQDVDNNLILQQEVLKLILQNYGTEYK